MRAIFSGGWFLVFCVIALTLSRAQPTSVPARAANDWPPTLDTTNAVTHAVDGRTIEHYTHGPRETWGYPPGVGDEWAFHPAQETAAAQENHNTFYVVSPKVPRSNAPLCVVLHSANRTAYDYLGYACLDRKVDPGDVPAMAATNPPADFYALYLNSTNDEWWGWSYVREHATTENGKPPPAELRVMDTIEWVVGHYKIDRNQIYLTGMSMGGCGGLGIGLPHGDVFAAVRVFAPAGTEYAGYTMGKFPAPTSASERDTWVKHSGLADPPVVVDSSSQVDGWAATQPLLLYAAETGHLPLVMLWGPYGHTCGISAMVAYAPCEVALAFPWLEIRRNEAYPVFTHASCDNQSPWINAPAKFDESGQSNAYFRWKNESDTPAGFSMQLWIAHPEIKGKLAMPDTATADVTFRRLQQFKVQLGRSYAWQLSQKGNVVASGAVAPDAGNLLTIPKVPLTATPTELSIK